MLSSVPAARINPWAIGTAALVNGSLLIFVLCISLRTIVPRNPAQQNHISIPVDALTFFTLPASRGGQGGGQNDPVEASRGRLPKIEKIPLAPPQIPLLDHPRLAIDPAIAVPQDIKLPDDPFMPTIGLPHSSNMVVLSGGHGTRAGIGSGDDDGLGIGRGKGFGPGDGDSIYTPGGDVSAPVPVVTPEAEFSDEARRNKFQGICMISIIVDAHGFPQNPRIIRPLGMGLDQKALDAVSRYRFKPAMRHGRPVAARITVAVNFRLF